MIKSPYGIPLGYTRSEICNRAYFILMYENLVTVL